MLRESDCHLPAAAGAASTWPPPRPRRPRLDRRRHRPPGPRPETPRPAPDPSIPIPPVLLQILRAHLKRYGTTPDGRIFRTARGGIIQDSAYSADWAAARAAALTPAQHASPLARRPYDLRHAAVSLWLNSGVPATEVARRAGHSVAVLLKIYAHCIDGQAEAANKRVADASAARGTARMTRNPDVRAGHEHRPRPGLASRSFTLRTH